MRILVQRLPGFIFVLLALFPLLLFVLKRYKVLEFNYPIITIAPAIFFLVACVWYLSLDSYFKRETQWKQKDLIPWVAGILFLLNLILLGRPDLLYFILFPSFFGYLYIVIKLMAKIQVLFEERSSWFLAVELLFPFYGMSTLTAELQRWEKAKRDEF